MAKAVNMDDRFGRLGAPDRPRQRCFGQAQVQGSKRPCAGLLKVSRLLQTGRYREAARQ